MQSTLTRGFAFVRDRALLQLWIAALAIWRGFAGDESEAQWMSREGHDLLAGSPLVHPDIWSWAPQPWNVIPSSPALPYLFGGARALLGDLGVPLAATLIVWASLHGLALVARLLGARDTAVTVSLLLVTATAPSLQSGRAGLPAFTLLLLVIAVPWRLRSRIAALAPFRRSLVAGGAGLVVSFIGVWLHGSWPAFAALAIVAWCLMLLHADFGESGGRVALGAWGSIGLALGTLVGPLGATALTNGARVARECRDIVLEWSAPWAVGGPWPALWILAAFLGLATIRRWHLTNHQQSWKRADTWILTLSLGCIATGWLAIRFLLLAFVALAPLVALWLHNVLTAEPTPRSERLTERYWANVLTAVLIALVPVLALQVLTMPRHADPAIQALPANCNLFSQDSVAKSVEYWRPDVRVWIDGRQDYWGRARLLRSNAYLDGRAALPMPIGTTCVLIERGQRPQLRVRLSELSGWHRLGASTELELWSGRS